MDFDQPPVVRVEMSPYAGLDPDAWPIGIAAVTRLTRDGLDLPGGVTFTVGDNGSGTSTLDEAAKSRFPCFAGQPVRRISARNIASVP